MLCPGVPQFQQREQVIGSSRKTRTNSGSRTGDAIEKIRPPTPALARKREREFRRDAERPLSTNSGLNTLALLPLPLAGEVDALDRTRRVRAFTTHTEFSLGADWNPRR